MHTDREEKIYTDEQLKYITFYEPIDTVLLACAGSGKTQCIAVRMINLVKYNKFKSQEVAMLTFSKNTQQDFIRRIDKIDTDKLINTDNIRTIDSLANKIIGVDGTVDVNLLSYKFKKYLEDTKTDDLVKNKDLNQIKILFVDEAQDLNETQFNIISNLNKKLKIIVNLIGDPNQNIYQFRKSSDKYLMNFKAQRFYLTRNFRSSQSIINFCKYLRPYQDTDILCGNPNLQNHLPYFMFTSNDIEVETVLKNTLNEIKEQGYNFKDIAILAPTRGGMYSSGSYGLCFVTNILTKLGYKFKQWYEEADEINNQIKYSPVDDNINVLTYMGSKGLEWKIVIVMDAEICLINKNIFNIEKHNHDRYLLYVACSRAVEHMIILSKIKTIRKDNQQISEMRINPWFKEIPKELYDFDGVDEIIYPEIKDNNKIDIDRSLTKLLNQLSEEDLDELSRHYDFDNITKKVTKIFGIKLSNDVGSSIFLGRYIEGIFVVFYRIHNNIDKYRYIELEKIIYSKQVIRSRYIKRVFADWLVNNKHLSWEDYDKIKPTLSQDIIQQVEKHCNKNHKLKEHIIVSDGFFDDYIIKNKEKLKKNYELYLTSTKKNVLKETLFNIILAEYALETQHYFHINNNGDKFRDLLVTYKNLIDKVITFAKSIKHKFKNNVSVTYQDILGEIDLLSDNGDIYEIKCVNEINIKHILQVIAYNVMQNNYKENEKHQIEINFYNLYKGLQVTYILETEDVHKIIKILQEQINKIKITT